MKNNNKTGNLVNLKFCYGKVSKDLVRKVTKKRLEKKLSIKDMSLKFGITENEYKKFEKTGEINLNAILGILIILGMNKEFNDLFNHTQISSMKTNK